MNNDLITTHFIEELIGRNNIISMPNSCKMRILIDVAKKPLCIPPKYNLNISAYSLLLRKFFDETEGDGIYRTQQQKVNNVTIDGNKYKGLLRLPDEYTIKLVTRGPYLRCYSSIENGSNKTITINGERTDTKTYCFNSLMNSGSLGGAVFIQANKIYTNPNGEVYICTNDNDPRWYRVQNDSKQRVYEKPDGLIQIEESRLPQDIISAPSGKSYSIGDYNIDTDNIQDIGKKACILTVAQYTVIQMKDGRILFFNGSNRVEANMHAPQDSSLIKGYIHNDSLILEFKSKDTLGNRIVKTFLPGQSHYNNQIQVINTQSRDMHTFYGNISDDDFYKSGDGFLTTCILTGQRKNAKSITIGSQTSTIQTLQESLEQGDSIVSELETQVTETIEAIEAIHIWNHTNYHNEETHTSIMQLLIKLYEIVNDIKGKILAVGTASQKDTLLGLQSQAKAFLEDRIHTLKNIANKNETIRKLYHQNMKESDILRNLFEHHITKKFIIQ